MDDAMTVMLVGLETAMADELADDERFDVRSADSVDQIDTGRTGRRSGRRDGRAGTARAARLPAGQGT